MKILRERLTAYALLMRIHQPIGTLLLLWPTLWALWIAGDGHPNYILLTIFTVCVFLMRSAGDVINDYADRNLDAHVARTKNRPLVTGKVSTREALILFSILVLISFSLVLCLNRLTIQLAFIGVFLTLFYPFTKRFFSIPQLILGFAYSWGIPMAFAATTNHIPYLAWVLYDTAGLWVIAYDTMYAMVDKDDDLTIGINSSAIFFGHNHIL